MARFELSSTRRASRQRYLLPLVAAAWIGFAGTASATSGQSKAPVPAPFECADGAAAQNGRPVAQLGLPTEVFGAMPLHAEDSPTTAEIFQTGIDEAARELGKEPRSRRLTLEQRRERAEFVFGNMLFVAIHELGHALVSELDLMVLAREEDVADAYATIGVLKCGADFARRVLVEAAKGWFLRPDATGRPGSAAGL